MTTTHETPAAIDVDAVAGLELCPFCGGTDSYENATQCAAAIRALKGGA